MEVKRGTSIYLFDNVITDELMNDIRIIIDNTEGTRGKYNTNVQCKRFDINDIVNQKLARIINNKIYEIVQNVILKLTSNNIFLQINDNLNFQYRRIYGPTRLHIDGILSRPKTRGIDKLRIGSLIIALNDNYIGGDLCFPNQNVKIKLKKGQAIFFPPYWTHPHYTTDLLDNTFRYTINMWLHE
jgi:hypothetical protein